jgi:threonine/homoserine/homoserine lactone efflux protein
VAQSHKVGEEDLAKCRLCRQRTLLVPWRRPRSRPRYASWFVALPPSLPRNDQRTPATSDIPPNLATRQTTSVSQILAFLGVSALVIMTPGQDTALTIKNTLAGGRRTGVLTALGVSTGQAAWTLAASAGVAALLVASEPAFLVLKLAGAAYLVYLGVQSLVAALRGRARAHAGAASGRPAVAFRQGILSNLANPKMAVFFSSLLPQFGSSFAELLSLGLLFCTFTLTWLAAYAVVVARAGDLLRRPRIRRALDAATGLALTLFGIRLATERR